jgi:hypothetical protein
MWEQNLVDFKQGLLIVDKQLQKIGFILRGEVLNFDTILSHFGQFQQTLLELLSFLTIMVNLLQFLGV